MGCASSSPEVAVFGTVAPGFESVKTLFEHKMETLYESGTQLCVYVGDEVVVDLWAAPSSETSSFTADSLVNVFSTTKSLTAIAVASLADQGLLKYEDPVALHWPEFAANGKDHVTVADVMRHEAGLPAFDRSLALEDTWTDNIRANKIGKVIEEQTPRWRSGEENRREYHSFTRGWIANEIFRRVHPEGLSIGEFLRREICGPLDADAFVGLGEEELKRIVDVHQVSMGFIFKESLKPKCLGRKMEMNFFQLSRKLFNLFQMSRSARSMPADLPPAFENTGDDPMNIDWVNDAACRRGESPSVNGNCSARGLAKVGAVMANRGKWDGREYLSQSGWEMLHDNPIRRNMSSWFDTTFTQGGVALFTPPEVTSASLHTDRAVAEGREGFYGWFGFGGAVFQWHPEERIGFGYVPASLYTIDLENVRGKNYQTEVLKCVAKNKERIS